MRRDGADDAGSVSTARTGQGGRLAARGAAHKVVVLIHRVCVGDARRFGCDRLAGGVAPTAATGKVSHERCSRHRSPESDPYARKDITTDKIRRRTKGKMTQVRSLRRPGDLSQLDLACRRVPHLLPVHCLQRFTRRRRHREQDSERIGCRREEIWWRRRAESAVDHASGRQTATYKTESLRERSGWSRRVSTIVYGKKLERPRRTTLARTTSPGRKHDQI